MAELYRSSKTRFIFVLISIVVASSALYAKSSNRFLSLNEAERIAVEQDPLKARHLELGQSLDNLSEVEKYLPNPKLKIGFDNFPVDTFDRGQEGMTQIKIGIQQPIPRGKSRRIRSDHKRVLSSRQRELAKNRRLFAKKEVRKTWLELYYWQHAEKIVRANRRIFKQMVRVTEDQYRAGRGMQHEVIRAQLEIDLLDDRIIKIKTMQDKSRAMLGKWIGLRNASRPLSKRMPAGIRYAKLEVLIERLPQHPLIQSDRRNVAAQQKLVDLANQSYKPKFSLYASYADRQNRPDLASVGFTVDIPFFKQRRNNKKVIASEKKVSAAVFARNERFLLLRKDLTEKYATWKRLIDRYQRYRRILLPKARMNSVTTMSSYQNKSSEFSTLVKARITELEIKLKAIRLKVDIRKTESDLNYLTGAQS